MFSRTIPSPPSIFQTYLLPALPFRRRTSSTDTATTTNTRYSPSSSPPALTSASASPDGITYLRGHTSHISCSRCHADLALTSQIISKAFTGRHGRAFLVSHSTSPTSAAALLPSSAIASNPAILPSLPNTHTHQPVPRDLVTGRHTVCDISCALCGSVLGWKYVGADDEAQRYKVGKFILETKRVVVGSCWEEDDGGADEDDDNAHELGAATHRRSRHQSSASLGDLREEDVLFDSQDEDECEDLFAGVWSPELASRRRNRRLGTMQT